MPQLFERLEFFYANKSCKIEWCGNKTYQIIKNMILSHSLLLKQSLCEEELSQVSILYFTEGKKYVKLCSYYISMETEFHKLLISFVTTLLNFGRPVYMEKQEALE